MMMKTFVSWFQFAYIIFTSYICWIALVQRIASVSRYTPTGNSSRLQVPQKSAHVSWIWMLTVRNRTTTSTLVDLVPGFKLLFFLDLPHPASSPLARSPSCKQAMPLDAVFVRTRRGWKGIYAKALLSCPQNRAHYSIKKTPRCVENLLFVWSRSDGLMQKL